MTDEHDEKLLSTALSRAENGLTDGHRRASWKTGLGLFAEKTSYM